TVQVSNRTRQSGFLCPAVKHGHIMSRIRQVPDNVSADETGSSDGEDPRVASPWSPILSRWPRRCPRSLVPRLQRWTRHVSSHRFMRLARLIVSREQTKDPILAEFAVTVMTIGTPIVH